MKQDKQGEALRMLNLGRRTALVEAATLVRQRAEAARAAGHAERTVAALHGAATAIDNARDAEGA